MWIVIYGNPVDGFRYVGPFNSHIEAMTYGETEPGDWWIAELDEPADENG